MIDDFCNALNLAKEVFGVTPGMNLIETRPSVEDIRFAEEVLSVKFPSSLYDYVTSCCLIGHFRFEAVVLTQLCRELGILSPNAIPFMVDDKHGAEILFCFDARAIPFFDGVFSYELFALETPTFTELVDGLICKGKMAGMVLPLDSSHCATAPEYATFDDWLEKYWLCNGYPSRQVAMNDNRAVT